MTGSVSPGSQTQTNASVGFFSEVIFSFGYVNGFRHEDDHLIVGGNCAGKPPLIEIKQPHACDSGRFEDGTDGTAEIAVFNPPQEAARHACSGRKLLSRYLLLDARLANELSQEDRCICGVTGIRPVLPGHSMTYIQPTLLIMDHIYIIFCKSSIP